MRKLHEVGRALQTTKPIEVVWLLVPFMEVYTMKDDNIYDEVNTQKIEDLLLKIFVASMVRNLVEIKMLWSTL